VIRRLAALSFLSCAAPVAAQDISLSSPIQCDLTRDCYIQQYVDRDPTSGHRDFTCAGLSYDGHKGTDFAVPDRATMAQGVNVLAAAAGTVTGLRDGMPDTGYSPATAAAIKGRECGNGVVLRHADGWETQYCHLRQGSITVQNGQQVAEGQVLGLVGQSGRAAFPHVHLSVRKNGKVIDPFAPNPNAACSISQADDLWNSLPPYRPGGIIRTGLSDTVPTYEAIKAGTAFNAIQPNSPALVISGFVFGLQMGDTLRLTLTGPQGELITRDTRYRKPKAQAYRSIGKKLKSGVWPAGTYSGTVTLLRDGNVIDTVTTTQHIPKN